MAEHTKETPRASLSDRAREIASHIISPIGKWLWRQGVHPDAVTATGLALVFLASVFAAFGQFVLAGMILLIGLPLDALDGAVARAMERTDKVGALLDSALDRYADGFIFVALSYYFAIHDQPIMFLLTQAALIGSVMVSYIRARAEGLGVNCTVGIFTRFERTAVITLMLLFPMRLDWGVFILAIGTNITALQRLWFVYHALKNKGN